MLFIFLMIILQKILQKQTTELTISSLDNSSAISTFLLALFPPKKPNQKQEDRKKQD
jgi:hypothetical protein